MADKDKPIIVIKKIIKGGHGHHGGAWKVAYADFVTAMMAFFLLMWLLNATDEEVRRGISNYFSPIGTTNSGEGSGGLFGGKTIQSDGALEDISSQPAVGPNFGLSEEKTTELDDGEFDSKQKSSLINTKTEEELDAAIAAREEKLFQEAEDELRKAIAAIPDLQKLGENLIIDVTPEGMRIHIVDRNKLSMFPNGSHVMYDHTYKLINLVEKAIRKLPNKLAIYGYTDAAPFKSDFEYSNWELSADRALASRRALIDSGIDPKRISKVVGKADTDPLFKQDPFSPQNRRISIVLLRQKKKK